MYTCLHYDLIALLNNFLKLSHPITLVSEVIFSHIVKEHEKVPGSPIYS